MISKQVDELKTVIFDLDGTLVKSSHDFWRMKEEMIGYLIELGLDGKSLSPQQTTNVLVHKMIDFLKGQGVSEAEITKALNELNELLNGFELENVKKTFPMEGALGVLKRLKDRGFKIGILTRSCEAYTHKVLDLWSMHELIEAIGARKDLLNAKPNPEAALEVCELLNTEPNEAVLVGDHPMDLACAQAVGMQFIGILGGSSSEETLRNAGTERIARNLVDLEKILLENGE
ncbi:MAG: HAD family hydrolase [Candidatus Hodarchaeota archaeon]